MKLFNQKKSTSLMVIIGGCVLLLISFGIRHSSGLYLIPISNQLGSGREIFGLAIAIQFLMIGFGSPIFGAIADKYGSDKAALYGVILFLIGLYLFSLVTNSFLLILSQAIFGLGCAGCGTAVILGAVGKAVSEKYRTLSLGIVMAAGSLGQFLIVPLSGALIEATNWQRSIVYLCFISLVMIIFVFALSLRSKNQENEHSQERPLKQVLGVAFLNKNYVLLSIGFFVCGFHVSFVATHLPAYLEDLSLPIWIGSWSLALIGLFNVFGTLLFGYLGDSQSKKNLLVILYSLRSFLFLIFIFLPKTELTILIFAALLGVLWLSTVPLTSGIISVIFGSRYMSMLYGFTFLVHQLGSFAGSWFGGRFYDFYGSYDVMWWICVALGFASAAMHAPINEKPLEKIYT
jgi:predicted MFS family arabinose efflux permease